MKVNDKLTAEYKGRKYRRPTDGKVITISHVLEIDGPSGAYFEAFYNVAEPEIGSTGHGTCSLTYLEGLASAG
jgi:hypothetical protein